MKQRMSNNEQVIDQIRKQNYFDKHRITREAFGVWYCGEPGTGIRAFRIIMVPGSIVVTGDLGDMVLRVNHRRPLRWALGSRFTPEGTYYPMSKLSRYTENTLFQPEMATEWLNERIAEARKYSDREEVRRYVKMAKEWKDFPFTDDLPYAERKWNEILHDNGEDTGGFRDHTIGTYYRYQALCWFMQHVNPDDPRFSEELKP